MRLLSNRAHEKKAAAVSDRPPTALPVPRGAYRATLLTSVDIRLPAPGPNPSPPGVFAAELNVVKRLDADVNDRMLCVADRGL